MESLLDTILFAGWILFLGGEKVVIDSVELHRFVQLIELIEIVKRDNMMEILACMKFVRLFVCRFGKLFVVDREEQIFL